MPIPMAKRGIRNTLLAGMGVRPVMLGAPLSEFARDLSFLRHEHGVGWAWDLYSKTGESEDDLVVRVEDSLIRCVSTHNSCIVDGHNLIGMQIEPALELLSAVPESTEEQEVLGERQKIYNLDGIMLWTRRGAIVSIDCSIEG